MKENTMKSEKKLALLGGDAEFSEQLHVGRPNIGNVDVFLGRTRGVLERRWLTNNGPLVQEFEKRLAAYLGVKHVIVTCNATVALEICNRALGLTGEVIVPSFTFVATAHALQWQEITPVFCDIDPVTHNLDPEKIEALITPRTSGVIGVHVWGRPCAVDELTEICRRRGLQLLFDAAHAFGCSHNGQLIGRFGAAEIFSFHATKFFNAFEGGAVATNDDDLAQKVRLMQNFGFAGTDNVIYVGTNGKMSEISAAMGLTSLDSLETFISVNQRNYNAYQCGLDGIPGITLIQYDFTETNNFQYIIIEVDETVTGISRDHLIKVLWAENVLSRRYFYPGVHKMEPYCSYFPHAGLLLPETEQLTQRVMSLPNGTAVSPDDIEKICSIIGLAVERSVEISEMLTLDTGTTGAHG